MRHGKSGFESLEWGLSVGISIVALTLTLRSHRILRGEARNYHIQRDITTSHAWRPLKRSNAGSGFSPRSRLCGKAALQVGVQERFRFRV